MESKTLRVGDRAPQFELAAANREGTVALGKLVQAGPVIMEFVRGVW